MLTGIQESDFGTYRCDVTNYAGTGSANITIELGGIYQYIKIFVVCASVCNGCGRGRNEFAGRVQKHHVRFSC